MTPPPAVVAVGPEDVEAAAATLTLAFADDPVIRALLPSARDHLTMFGDLMRVTLSSAAESRSAFMVEGGGAASAWFPPRLTEEARRAARQRAERMEALLSGVMSGPGKADVLATLDAVQQAHPHEPHWYLFSIGADPAQQGRGLGSLIMKHVLPLCDAEGMPAYLESSNPRNVPFYERHGFEVASVVQVGAAPPITLMIRGA